MRKTSIAILVLSTALITSNGWWLYNAVDFGITHTHAMQTCSEDSEALRQVLSILPVAVQPGTTRDAILAAARRDKNDAVFEKDGHTWVGSLGLRFDTQGRLLEVKR